MPPRVIHITHKSRLHAEKAASKWRQLNPGWQLRVSDDDDCRQFLETLSARHAEVWDWIGSGPIRADFWRVCKLRAQGGLYVDADINPHAPIDDFVCPKADFVCVIGRSNQDWGVFNPHFLWAPAGNAHLGAMENRWLATDTSTPWTEKDYWRNSVVFFMTDECRAVLGDDRLVPDTVFEVNGQIYQWLLEVWDGKNSHSTINLWKGRLVLHARGVEYDQESHSFVDDQHLPVGSLRHAFKDGWSEGQFPISGRGSTHAASRGICQVLSRLCKLGDVPAVTSITDLGCGDLTWMGPWLRQHPQVRYTGMDVMLSSLQIARQRAPPNAQVLELDASADVIPAADLLLERDVIQHLPYDLGMQLLHNVARSQATWFLGTLDLRAGNAPDMAAPDFRPLNLLAKPFSLPTPHSIFSEEKPGGFAPHEKWYGLWGVEELALALIPSEVILQSLRVHTVNDVSLVRCGSSGDGGYVMGDTFAACTLALSYGVGDNCHWDTELMWQAPNCVLHQYDHTVREPPARAARLIFHCEPGTPLSCQEHMLQLLPGQKVPILKMDIEGAEWNILDVLDLNLLTQFDQIILEVHTVGSDPWLHARVLRKLAQHFWLVHAHGNNWGEAVLLHHCIIPSVLELSYVNKHGRTAQPASALSTHLDVRNNPNAPEFHLGLPFLSK